MHSIGRQHKSFNVYSKLSFLINPSIFIKPQKSTSIKHRLLTIKNAQNLCICATNENILTHLTTVMTSNETPVHSVLKSTETGLSFQTVILTFAQILTNSYECPSLDEDPLQRIICSDMQ